MEKHGIIDAQTPPGNQPISEKTAGVTDPEMIAKSREQHPVTEFAKEAEEQKKASGCCRDSCSCK